MLTFTSAFWGNIRPDYFTLTVVHHTQNYSLHLYQNTSYKKIIPKLPVLRNDDKSHIFY